MSLSSNEDTNSQSSSNVNNTKSKTKTHNNKSKTKDIMEEPFPYEFGGPIGSFFTMLFLPIVVMSLMYWTDVGYVKLDGIVELSLSDIYICSSSDENGGNGGNR